MRRRLVVSTVAVAMICTAVLGLPLALLARSEVSRTAGGRLADQATAVATAVEDRLDVGRPPDLGRLAADMPGRRIEVSVPTGSSAAAGPVVAAPTMEVRLSVDGAAVVVEASRRPLDEQLQHVTLLIAGLALAAVAAAWGLASWQGRRLTAPLARLVDQAALVGRGVRSRPSPTGSAEVDHVAEVLARSAAQVEELAERQRSFAADAAHQLRSPLSGISIRLEEMAELSSGSVREEAEAALEQVGRLAGAITDLLQRATGDERRPGVVPVAAVVSEVQRSFGPVLAASGRRIVARCPSGVAVEARRDHLLAVVGCLVDNAVTHGRGQVTVSVVPTAGRVEVRVDDEGPGVPPGLEARMWDRSVSGAGGTGIGLALARSLAEADGGTVALEGGSSFVVSLREAAPGEVPPRGKMSR